MHHTSAPKPTKVSFLPSNALCTQPLYLFGVYREDSLPDWGLFCWCAFCASNGLKFIACIGEDKLTRDLIRKNGVFSATVVTEALLSAADFCGTHAGYSTDKSTFVPFEQGAQLNVPIPVSGVWTLELRVAHTLHPGDHPASDIYVCDIVNVLADPQLADPSLSMEEKLALLRPVITLSHHYLPVTGPSLGCWGHPSSPE